MAKPPPTSSDDGPPTSQPSSPTPSTIPPPSPSTPSGPLPPTTNPGFTTRLRSYFTPTPPSHPLEPHLLLKLDFFILTFCSLSYFLNYLDRTALSNAYVSGMKESLSFRGSQLNQINTCFTIGYVLGQIPSNLSLHYIPPRIFFPGMMVLWAGLTMVTAAARRPGDVMAIRFFQGVAESTTFVGTHYILGSWYTERELGKRSGVFTASGLAGTMIGGFVQSGIYRSMNGLRGMDQQAEPAVVPSSGETETFTPHTSPSSGDHRRPGDPTQHNNKKPPHQPGPPPSPLSPSSPSPSPSTSSPSPDHPIEPTTSSQTQTQTQTPPAAAKTEASVSQTYPLSLPFLRSLFTSYHFPSFILLWILAGETESFSSNALLSLYLKSHPSNPAPSADDPNPTPTYSVAQLNNYPTGVPAVGIVSTLFFAFITDMYPRRRSVVGYFIGVIGILTPAMILAAQKGRFGDPSGDRATGVVMGMYYLAGSVYACQATFFAWANDAMTRDGKEAVFRGVVLAGMNLGSNAVNAWWSIVFYGAGMAPWFERGMWAMIATSLALAAWTGVLEWLERRARRRRREREVQQARRLRREDVGPAVRNEKAAEV